MAMNPVSPAPAIKRLENAIASLFEPFRTDTLSGAFSAALAGEYYGAATFDAFAHGTRDPAEREFWELSRELELLTMSTLEDHFRSEGMALPQKAPFERMGRETAAHFPGESHEDYCAWIAPVIEDALRDFRALRAMCIEQRDITAAEELVAHEVAFQQAWRLLPAGFEAACTPLRARVDARSG